MCLFFGGVRGCLLYDAAEMLRVAGISAAVMDDAGAENRCVNLNRITYLRSTGYGAELIPSG